MRVAVTGATGTIGREVVRALVERGDEVTVLSRDAERARAALGGEIDAYRWTDPKTGPPPADALRGRDGVVNLLGESLAQRWSDEAKREIRDSRVLGTRNLVSALGELSPDAPVAGGQARERPGVLVSQSASGFYGARGDEPVDESVSPADDFLARVCRDWEAEARRAEDLDVRVVTTRTGVVLTSAGGALKEMLLPFKLGVGGPVGGGRQYVPWVHADDVAGALLFCLDTDEARGPVNVAAPRPATNRQFAKALGRVLRRPAVVPVPAFAVRVLYGEMATVVTTGARMVPRRLEQLGYAFKSPELDEALRAALAR